MPKGKGYKPVSGLPRPKLKGVLEASGVSPAAAESLATQAMGKRKSSPVKRQAQDLRTQIISKLRSMGKHTRHLRGYAPVVGARAGISIAKAARKRMRKKKKRAQS
jgi:hypothetical protein